MNFKEAVAWLDSFDEFSMKLGLDRVQQFLRLAKLDYQDLKVIHVAGSNGKGSVSALLARILQAEGYRVGLYTSPHLLAHTERIAIDGKPCSPKEFAALMDWAKKIVALMEETPMHFEILTCAAIKHFLDKKVDFVVAEVGLGGRLDATNVLQGLLTAITNISLEHTQILGSTLQQIASEKAGIIKFNSVVVTNADGVALETIEKTARAKNAAVLQPRFEPLKVTSEGSEFDLFYPVKMLGLKVSLIGYHQVENAALAASAAYMLRKRGFAVSEDAIRAGLKKAFWPCRLQVVQRKPLILIDAGHNPDCMRRLSQSIDLFAFRDLVLVFGCYKDKNYQAMLDFICPKARAVILTKPQSPRAAEIKDLLPCVDAKTVLQAPTVAEALAKAEELASKEDLILVCGSLSVAREALRHWKMKIPRVC